MPSKRVMLVTRTIFLLISVSAQGARGSDLDRLLERFSVAPVPSPPPDSQTPTTLAPRLRHHHRHRSPQADSNRLYSANVRKAIVPSSSVGHQIGKTSHKKLDWKKMPARKPSDKSWTEYKTTNYQTPGVAAMLVPRGENQEHAHNEVFRHNVKMARETVCRYPQSKVIRVSDHYPSGAKVYMPACTKLHQCAQDTGCCPPTQKCGPKTTHRVELYFYVLQTTSPQSVGKRPPAALGIEKLPFYNHTECECQDRADEMPRDVTESLHQPQLPPHTSTTCECPSEYTVRYLSSGRCSCDCFDKQRDCTKYKRGKEYFNHRDRLCIATGNCKQPSCDYGFYMKRIGRCPRKHERIRSWSNYT